MRIVYLFLLLCLSLMTVACNTTKGFGQDVQATGHAIEDTADDASDDDDDNR